MWCDVVSFMFDEELKLEELAVAGRIINVP